MSNVVTDVYDEIITTLGTLFPTKTRIPFPYALEDNQAQFLMNGYGVKIGSAQYEPLEFTSFTVGRNFSVVVTREVFRTDSDKVVIDDIVKGLLEDIHTIQKSLYQMDAAGGNSINVLKVDVGPVSGIQEVATTTKFLSMEAEFFFQITDSF